MMKKIICCARCVQTQHVAVKEIVTSMNIINYAIKEVIMVMTDKFLILTNNINHIGVPVRTVKLSYISFRTSFRWHG